jgi:hypothetical protein
VTDYRFTVHAINPEEAAFHPSVPKLGCKYVLASVHVRPAQGVQDLWFVDLELVPDANVADEPTTTGGRDFLAARAA